MFSSKHNLHTSCFSAALALVTACGTPDANDPQTESVDSVTETPDDAADDSATTSAAAAKRGALVAEDRLCNSCHTTSYAGNEYYSNITPDEVTGIGAWSDQEIADAIVKGVDVNGEKLCRLMPRAQLSDGDLADLIAYLRSLPPVTNEVTQVCSGHGG